VGFSNYARLLEQPALAAVVANTVVWVATVVAVTVVVSLGLAQFLNQRFPGRRFVRWALIVPWAASLVMTAKLFVWIYDYYFGILNHVLVSAGRLAAPVDWLGEDATGDGRHDRGGHLRVAAVHHLRRARRPGRHSLTKVYEAARVDGASRWRTYRSVTLPLLRPALVVATVLNVIYVFNSFPIVWTLNDRNPGFGHDTLITYMYKIAFKSAARDVGLAAALGIVNVLMILVAVAVYLRTVQWREVEA
jgi:ABC-type sugar transport system permease subunit